MLKILRFAPVAPALAGMKATVIHNMLPIKRGIAVVFFLPILNKKYLKSAM